MKFRIFPRSTEGKVYLIIALLAWVYVLLRAICIPVVHDEAATFFHYIQSGNIIPPDAHWDANNHILNSILSRGTYLLFGSDLWALRLPNVLSFALYLVFVRKISLLTRDRWMRWSLIAGLIGMQFLLDYFSLTRGYGLSMAFFLGAVWYLMRLSDDFTISRATGVLGWSLLACAANLTLMVPGLAMWGLAFYLWIRGLQRHRPKGKEMLFWGAATAMGVFGWRFLIDYSLELKTRDLLYYGGEEGFIADTVTSLSTNIFPGGPEWIKYGMVAVYTVLLIAFLCHHILRSKWVYRFTSSDVPMILLTANVLGILCMHELMDLRYPEDRTGLHLVPLFILSLIFVPGQFQATKLLSFLPFLFFIQFPFRANITHTTFWNDEHIPGEFVEEVHDWQARNGRKATVAGYFGRWLCWSYINHVEGGEFNQVHYTSYPQNLADFQIVDTSEYWEIWKPYYDQIGFDEASGLSLLKRKQRVQLHSMEKAEHIKGRHAEEEYIGLYDTLLVAEKRQSYMVHLNMKLASEETPLYPWIVVALSDSKGRDIDYQSIPLDYLHIRWDRTELDQEITLFNVPEGEVELHIYIWNREMQPFSIINGELEVSKVESLLYSGDVKEEGNGN